MLIPTCAIKLVELVMAVICLCLFCYSYDLTDVTTLILCAGTYLGYIMVLSGELVGIAVSAGADPLVSVWWTACAAALYSASGALTLDNWRAVPVTVRRTQAFASAYCALIMAVILALDAILTFFTSNRVREDKFKD